MSANNMTPLEIVDYKNTWVYDNAYTVYTEFWHECFDFCNKNFEKHRWAARKHMRQDDAHWFLFERKEDYDIFLENFNELECWNQTNTFEKMTAKKDQTL